MICGVFLGLVAVAEESEGVRLRTSQVVNVILKNLDLDLNQKRTESERERLAV